MPTWAVWRVQKSEPADLDRHIDLYAKAIAFQKALGYDNWVSFDRAVVEERFVLIEESNPVLWGDRNNEPAVYLRRLVVDRENSGGVRAMDMILGFLRAKFGATKKYIRMDTKSGNDRLNKYYTTQCGFVLIKEIRVGTELSLPVHYHNSGIALFESKI